MTKDPLLVILTRNLLLLQDARSDHASLTICLYRDNLFASYLFALDARDWAYSNLIQVIRSKTSQGFIANFASAGQKSLDRTEPMIGAKIVLELYRKFNDKWIVDLLLNDLIDWHDWFATYRILKPKGLICLGSNPVDGDTYWSPNTLNSAKLESGLDNSPSTSSPCSFFCSTAFHSCQFILSPAFASGGDMCAIQGVLTLSAHTHSVGRIVL